MTTTFNELGLNPDLIAGLAKDDITEPTPIQAQAIPVALENKDIIGQSVTGSGKTLAYLLPLFQRIDTSKKETQAMILAPTHELVVQINKEIQRLAQQSGITVTSGTMIGKVSIKRQVEKLKKKPHIIVGSTGRILELIKMKKIKPHTTKTIVIDEGDRMLDHNNLAGVKDVIKTTLRDRQLMVFSASVTDISIKIASSLMKDPVLIKVEEASVNPDIEHMYFTTEKRNKIDILRKIVASEKPKRAIVFLNTAELNEVLTKKLNHHNIKSASILGSGRKEDRKKALDGFRSGKVQLLIASDLAARGLDIKGVTHIINFDLPEETNDYLHRVGRTGRAKNKGTAISVVTPNEVAYLRRAEKNFGITITEKEMYDGKIYDAGVKRSKKTK